MDWASKLVNRTIFQYYDRVMTGNTSPSTFIVAAFIILGTQKTEDLNKIYVKKGLSPLQINPNAVLSPMPKSQEQNIMASESPGGALFTPPNML